MTTPQSDDAHSVHEAALDALPDPILVYDDTCVLYANEAARRALGGSGSTDLVGMPVQEFIFADLAEVNDSRRGYVMRDGVAFSNLPVKIRGLNGAPMTLHVDIRPITFRGQTAAMATLARG